MTGTVLNVSRAVVRQEFYLVSDRDPTPVRNYLLDLADVESH